MYVCLQRSVVATELSVRPRLESMTAIVGVTPTRPSRPVLRGRLLPYPSKGILIESVCIRNLWTPILKLRRRF